MPYVALQKLLDPTAPHGWRFYDRMHYLSGVSDEFIGSLMRRFEDAPTPQSHVVIGWMGGAIERVPPGVTAFDHRDARAFTWIIGCSGTQPVDPTVEWVRRVWDDTAGFAREGVYVNALDSGRSARDAYADEIWARLVEVKRRYDPDGVFSGNGIG
jgi:FAD/FMN-containing dehydrogenase